MTNLDKAVATQLANIEKRTGKSIAELTAIVKLTGANEVDAELIAWVKSAYEAAG